MVSVYVTRFLSLCRVEDLRPCQLLCLFRLFLLTAGTPSMGSSYTLNCSVPGRGISGLLRSWLFPFLHHFHLIGAFLIVPSVLGTPCKKTRFDFCPEEVSSYFVQWYSWKGERPRVAGPNPSPYMVSPAMWLHILKVIKFPIEIFELWGELHCYVRSVGALPPCLAFGSSSHRARFFP